MIEPERLKRLRKEERALVEAIRIDVQKTDSECRIAYLPVPTPESRVRYILIAMEPSIDRWAGTDEHSEERAKEMVEKKGFTSCMYSWEDFAFLYSVKRFLSQSHYVTDVSKAAMPVKYARKWRGEIYPRWMPLLGAEIEIVGQLGCTVLFVGKEVDRFLEDKGLPRKARKVDGKPLVHYAWSATSKRREIANDCKTEFKSFNEVFRQDLCCETVLTFAEKYMLKQGVSEEIIDKTVRRLGGSHGELSRYLRELMFAYYHYFSQVEGSNAAQAKAAS